MSAWTVAVRADASSTLGSGHVMRCLTLAAALRQRGATLLFICRQLPGHLGGRIQQQGFGLQWLAETTDAADDARQTLAAITTSFGPAGCHLLVQDHYSLAAAWQQTLRPACGQLLVIDDLADRAHACDALLDANLGRRSADYDALLPAGTTRWIGPHHALLRPEFTAARPASLARRGADKWQHLLISMGGADPQQATLRVLQALADGSLPRDATVTVVLGAQAQACPQTRAPVQALLATLPCTTSLCLDVADMAPLLQAADLAIGAAGGSAWERCCLGLPSLLLVLADTQRPGTPALVAAGAALALGGVADLPGSLHATLHAVAQPGVLQAMSAAAAAVTDGLGTQRVADALLAS